MRYTTHKLTPIHQLTVNPLCDSSWNVLLLHVQSRRQTPWVLCHIIQEWPPSMCQGIILHKNLQCLAWGVEGKFNPNTYVNSFLSTNPISSSPHFWGMRITLLSATPLTTWVGGKCQHLWTSWGLIWRGQSQIHNHHTLGAARSTCHPTALSTTAEIWEKASKALERGIYMSCHSSHVNLQ
jgi:hypothetical protein